MPFNFRELSITLTTSFENQRPMARLVVGTCGDPSLVMQFRTCETNTQQCPPTGVEALRLRNQTGNPGDLQALHRALEEMLGDFGPNGRVTRMPIDDSGFADQGDAGQHTPEE
jgi:hypothetical protein